MGRQEAREELSAAALVIGVFPCSSSLTRLEASRHGDCPPPTCSAPVQGLWFTLVRGGHAHSRPQLEQAASLAR